MKTPRCTLPVGEQHGALPAAVMAEAVLTQSTMPCLLYRELRSLPCQTHYQGVALQAALALKRGFKRSRHERACSLHLGIRADGALSDSPVRRGPPVGGVCVRKATAFS